MEISNQYNAVNNDNAIEEIQNTAPVTNRANPDASQAEGSEVTMTPTDRATFSAAGSGMAQVANTTDVRMDKVASVQQALANGTYDVPASAVASKMVDSMLGKRS